MKTLRHLSERLAVKTEYFILQSLNQTHTMMQWGMVGLNSQQYSHLAWMAMHLTSFPTLWMPHQVEEKHSHC